MAAIRTFRDLLVWQKAHELVLSIYRLTKGFPPEERFGLIPQLRRAVVSVAANIAEGFVRKGKLDKLHFYNMAKGSLEECKYYLILAQDLGYTSDVAGETKLAEEVGRLLYRLIKSIEPS